jgi:DNA end-binding protein Ku
MPTRAYWKGFLRISLVTVAVELHSAVSHNRRLALHQIHKPSGKRIRYQKVALGVGPVKKEDIVKGFEIDKDEYVLLEDAELDEIQLESKRTIDLVQFVEHCEIDPRYFDKPYYILPRDDEVASEGYAVIRDALRATKTVALGQMAIRGRDYIVAIRPCGNGLLLETLRYADEIRQSDTLFDDISGRKVDPEMLGLAEELIHRKSAAFDPDAFKSQYVKALKDLIAEKRDSGAVASTSDEAREPAAGNVVDLMEALKKSVARGKRSSRKKSTRKAKSATRSTKSRKRA